MTFLLNMIYLLFFFFLLWGFYVSGPRDINGRARISEFVAMAGGGRKKLVLSACHPEVRGLGVLPSRRTTAKRTFISDMSISSVSFLIAYHSSWTRKLILYWLSSSNEPSLVASDFCFPPPPHTQAQVFAHRAASHHAPPFEDLPPISVRFYLSMTSHRP
ncbi:hypothetical protein PILCRDRAFT_652798 [Piloderma croceum F 1598]|uniref:Uncharacterized protein n=1 Tax=Piloderma croceum (strain F 1598) TaxID=765440 RepID=A0A0C3AQM1_PILCF|nr:hypothetical protein PILCRDRAFT_652798 [Piloderma croceum F 1598]